MATDNAASRRRGRLSKQGSPHLRWALVQAAQHAARRPDTSPDGECYLAVKQRAGSQRATLSIARKTAKRPTTYSPRQRTPPDLHFADAVTDDAAARANGRRRGCPPVAPDSVRLSSSGTSRPHRDPDQSSCAAPVRATTGQGRHAQRRQPLGGPPWRRGRSRPPSERGNSNSTRLPEPAAVQGSATTGGGLRCGEDYAVALARRLVLAPS